MTRIAPVNLAFNPKTLWFDARDLELDPKDFVVVLTARGLELGHMAGPVFEATEDDLEKLKSALKPVKRVATEEDIAQGEEMERLSKDALVVFKEMVAESDVEMRPISVEYLLEGDKAVFYFEAEDRVDFRDLVRSLAARFHVRVDMRQIGVRDEARMVGGYGHCGQQLCCARMGGEFCPVSIRMAKEQDLSLNPQKISGVCGRLMCCLRYEFDAYKDFKSRAPKQNAMIDTPAGPAKVVGLDVPREIVTLRTEEDRKNVQVPLCDMVEPEEGQRPNAVGEEAWERATAPQASEVMSATYLTSQLTGTDQLGSAQAVRRNNANVKNATGSTPMPSSPQQADPRRRRRRKEEPEPEVVVTDTHRQRRRRSTKISADGMQAAEIGIEKPVETKDEPKVVSEPAKREVEPKADNAGSDGRRRRRRGGSGRRQTADEAGEKKQQQQRKSDEQPQRKSGPRPGQKSSGLRRQDGDDSAASQEQSSNQRRRRRRTHRGGKGEQGASNES